MSGKSAPLLLIGLGSILLYVAYTGRLKGAWEGITGKYDSPPSGSTGTVSGPHSPSPSSGTEPVTYPGVPGQEGTTFGGGEGGKKGVWMVTATGDMVITNPGIYS